MKIGDKVLCIDDSIRHPRTPIDFQQWVEEGVEYTVRHIYPQAVNGGILVEELRNKPMYIPMVHGKIEPSFAPNRFVLVSEVDKEIEEAISNAI